MERYTKGGAFKERCNGNIPYAEIISFVSKVEDLCEKYQFANFEELKNWIDWTHEKCMEVHFKELKQENQLLKDRWQKMKEYAEYVEDEAPFILNKMQELEKNMDH